VAAGLTDVSTAKTHVVLHTMYTQCTPSTVLISLVCSLFALSPLSPLPPLSSGRLLGGDHAHKIVQVARGNQPARTVPHLQSFLRRVYGCLALHRRGGTGVGHAQRGLDHSIRPSHRNHGVRAPHWPHGTAGAGGVRHSDAAALRSRVRCLLLLFCCSVVLLFCCSVVLLFCCSVVLLFCCSVVIVGGCNVQVPTAQKTLARATLSVAVDVLC
jgi:hypothetical protein